MLWTPLQHWVALALAVTTLPGSSEAQTAGRELYARAMTSMHQVPKSTFLDYRFEMLTSHGERTRRDLYAVQERTSDHLGRMEGLRSDGTRSGDVQVLPLLVPPDLFLRTAIVDQTRPQGDTPLATIGTVVASNYDVTLVSSEDVDGCGAAAKLQLVPKSDPERYTLRTLWVDRTTARVCKAAVFRHVRIITPTTAVVTLDLAADGYVAHWKFSGTGRLVFAAYSGTVEGWYADIKPSPPLDAALFR